MPGCIEHLFHIDSTDIICYIRVSNRLEKLAILNDRY